MELLTVSIRWLEGTSQVNSIAAVPRVKVSADGHGVVSHAGVGMLREVAGLTGLSTLVTVALADPSTDSTTITAMQVGTIMSSTPSSRRRTTSCLLCSESDAIVGNFNARQQVGWT
jgi:hypothetical protein